MSEPKKKLQLSQMKIFLVKFFFKEDQAHLIPNGIKEVDRRSVRQMDARHAERAKTEGHTERATVGRVREGRVDTGDSYSLTNVQIELDPSLHLVGCHRHFQAGKIAKGRQREKKSVHVVTLSYSKTEPEEPFVLNAETSSDLMTLQYRIWSVCDIWANPSLIGTLNFKGLNDLLPVEKATKYLLGENPN